MLNYVYKEVNMLKPDFSRYEVSADGLIVDTSNNQPCKVFKSNKYLQCYLIDKHGKGHVLGVHTVVAMFNCDDYFEGCVVHHVDGDTTNNHASNLKCMRRSDHSRKHVNPQNLINYVFKKMAHLIKVRKWEMLFVNIVELVQNIDGIWRSGERMRL